MYFLHFKTILFREVCFLLFLFNIISDNCFENFFLFFSLLLILPCNCCVPTFPANISFIFGCTVQFSHSVVSDSFATPWTAACQASLSITSSQSLLKLISIVLVMPSNHLILCCPLLLLPSIFPSITSFPVSQFFASGGQSIGVSASASVLRMTIQD